MMNWSVYIVRILITTFRALAWSDNYYISLWCHLDRYHGEEGGGSATDCDLYLYTWRLSLLLGNH